jgi:membrane protease YdiL (CAAX protease family)
MSETDDTSPGGDAGPADADGTDRPEGSLLRGYVPRGPRDGAWPDERPRLLGRLVGVPVLLLILLAGGFSVVILGAVGGLAVLVAQAGSFEEATRLAMQQEFTALFFFATFFIGFGGFLLLGLGVVGLANWKVRHALALRRPGLVPLLGAALGGLFVGLFPGWVAQEIIRWMPELGERGTLELIGRLMAGGTLLDTVLMATTVTLGAGFLEELCFRGLLWNALERLLPGWGGQLLAFLLTSTFFFVAHLDPVQAPAIVFTAFFLGWLRWQSGSIWPGIVAHLVNNGLATILTIALAGMEGDEMPMPLWLALLGALVTLLVAVVVGLVPRKPPATPEDAWADRVVRGA